MTQKISILSFFAGAGFLDLGFEKNGAECKFVNEYEPAFLRAHKYAREQMGVELPTHGYDGQSAEEFLEPYKRSLIQHIVSTSRSQGEIVGFIAGPPCPDFSTAGRNRGGSGEKGRLSAVYMELIKEHRPDFFLFENVKGLWKTARHKAFYDELRNDIEKSGYYVTDRLLNALEFGAPQNRDRIILLGFNKQSMANLGISVSETEDGIDFPWDSHKLFDKSSIMALPWPDTDAFEEGLDRPMPEGILSALAIESWFRRNDVYNHPNSSHSFKPKQALRRFETIGEGNTHGKSFKRLHRWRFSPTCAYGNNEVHIHPYYPRRISAAEGLAIQSLPKEFCFPADLTLSQMFKIIGNGVPFLLADGIAKSISDFLGVESPTQPVAVRISPQRAAVQA